MKNIVSEKITSIRDAKTPDLFHSLTELDIELIAVKLMNDPKARFKNYLNIESIRDFVIFVSEYNPLLIKKFQRYKNKKPKSGL